MKERENVKKIDELIKELDNVRNSIKCEFPMVDYCVDCHEIVDYFGVGMRGIRFFPLHQIMMRLVLG